MHETAIQLSDKSKEAIDRLNQTLAPLMHAANQPITDQASLVASGNAKTALETYVKSVKSIYGLEIDPLEAELKILKNSMAALISPVKERLEVLVVRQRDWMAQEKRAAEAEAQRKRDELAREQQRKAEEDRRAAEKEAADKRREAVGKINSDLDAGLIGKREAAKRLKEAGAEEEAAKQTAAAVAEEAKSKPAPEVRVAPSIPKVQGVRNQTYHFAVVERPEALILDFFKAAAAGDSARMDFLRRFLTVNESEVKSYAKDVKDPKAVMASLPGVRAWSEG